jgi:hypothetical protein
MSARHDHRPRHSVDGHVKDGLADSKHRRTETPRPLTVLRRTVPAHVDGAVLQAREKLPADRFATVPAIVARLMAGDGAKGVNIASGELATQTATTVALSMARMTRSCLWRMTFGGVERTGIEPATPCLQSRCSPS